MDSITQLSSNPITSITGDSNFNSNHELLDKQLLKSIKSDLGQCISEGVTRYKLLMESLLETKVPLKDSHLLNYHRTNLKVIIGAVDASYKPILDPQLQNTNFVNSIEKLLSLTKTKIETAANKLYNEIYLRKHEIQVDGIVKKVKGLSNQAEMHYDEHTEELSEIDVLTEEDNATKDKIIATHRQRRREAIQLFERLLEQENIGTARFWKSEIKKRLHERLEDVVGECEEDYSDSDSEREEVPQVLMELLDEHQEGNEADIIPEKTANNKVEQNRDADILTVINEVWPQLPAQQEIQNVKFNEQSQLHAGILIDQNVFKIGVYSSQSNTCTEILSTVPEICFLHDRILVGQDASQYRHQKGNGWTHFDIFELLTSRRNKCGSPFQIVTRQHTISCIHEVIGAFLRHVLQSLVPLTENGVGRIIFTAPFILTSVVKERLQKGAIYAGLKDFRILSTLLTAAASTLHMEPIPKHVFVTDIHPSYFSVAIVSMSGASIVAKNQCGSENINEYFQSSNFLEWHQSLSKGSELPIPCRNHISNIYEKAIDQVLINMQGLPSVYRIFTSNDFPLIESIVADILSWKLSGGHISSDLTVGSPLLGASLLASQSNGRIEARDSSRYNLGLTILTSQYGAAKNHSQEFQHVRGNQFSASSAGCLFRQEKIPLSFNINGDGNLVLFVTLDEIYCPNHSIIEVCRYKIILSRGSRGLVDWFRAWLFGEELSLRPVCLMNDDGVLSLHLNCSPEYPTIINVERVYSSGECNSVCDKYFRNLDPLQMVSLNEEIAGSSRLPLLQMEHGEFNV